MPNTGTNLAASSARRLRHSGVRPVDEAGHLSPQWAIVEDRGCLPESVAPSPVIKEAAKPDVQRRLRAVLFIDVVESVRLIHLDEEGTIGRWRAFANDVQDQYLPRFGGRRVKLTGDGMLLEFESTVSAVECAIAIQQRLVASEGTVDANRRIRVRMGIHASDVITDEFDIYGDGVNLAARLRDLGGPDEIVVSAAVRDQLTDGLGVVIEDLGERKLKGFERPIRAFRAWPPGPMPALSVDRRRRTGDKPAIAVLPFRNLSGVPRHDFLGDLIAEDVIADLSRFSDLFVISRLSTAPFRDRSLEPRNVAEVLGVRYILAGNLHASDSRFRVMVELTEAENGRAIWADRFEGSLGDIFDVQDRMSIHITTRVLPQLRHLELARARAKRPEDLTAYERTLRAIDYLHRSTPEDLDRAQAMLLAAIAADPNYGAPHAWLARLHVLRVGQGVTLDSVREASDADRHIEAALERDENDSWALSVHGLVAAYLHKDLDLAQTRYDRALALNPSAVSAWAWSASANAWLGNGDKATELVQRAISLSPLDPHMYMFSAIACTAAAVAGNYDDAIEWGRRCLRENRGHLATHKVLTIALSLSGREAEARAAATELLAREPGLTVAGFRNRYPGSQSAHIDRFCEALAATGVPR